MIDETREEIYISFARYVLSLKYKARPFIALLLAKHRLAHTSEGISGIRAREFNAEDARSQFANKSEYN